MKGLVITFPNPKAAQDCAIKMRAAHEGVETTVEQDTTLRITYPPRLDWIADTLIKGIEKASKERGYKVDILE